MDRLVEERIALNNAAFRNANERIGAAAGVYGVDMPVPFICECANRDCSEIIRLDLDDYEEIRADSRHFLNAPGHHAAAEGAAVVVAERDGYVIVEKVGHAGDIVDALDERKPEEGFERLASSEE
jgi:hypothetical protein